MKNKNRFEVVGVLIIIIGLIAISFVTGYYRGFNDGAIAQKEITPISDCFEIVEDDGWAIPAVNLTWEKSVFPSKR